MADQNWLPYRPIMFQCLLNNYPTKSKKHAIFKKVSSLVHFYYISERR